MRKFVPIYVVLFVLATHFQHVYAQNIKQNSAKCATETALEQAWKANPAEYEALKKKWLEAAKNSSANKTSALTTPVTIPVVIHVVHNTPSLVTEEQVDYLLNRLNLDYSGTNSDSTNATNFYGVRGHSLIRFTRARRDPNGNLTNGLEKRVSPTGIYATTYQRVKHSSTGGLDPWDVTKYYNIWVAADSSGQGLLGIAPGIGPGNATETTSSTTGIDGICLEISAFSNGCYSVSAFNLARTAVHEIGHNFGLYHTFSGCTTGADFTQLSTGQTLPSSLLTASDDTPNQNTSTSGCPTTITASDCSGVSSKMFQNYMDYTNDACLTMFTNGQVARMHYVLENFRVGYLTSDGAVPPSSVPTLDASATEVINPGGSEFSNTTCTLTTYPIPSCPGSLAPKLSFTNKGSSTITSITVTMVVNGGTPTITTFTGLNVLTNGVAVLTMSASNFVVGTNTIVFTLSAPNGGVDAVTTNNSITTSFIIGSPQTSPISQGFESATFPPANWTLSQLSGSGNWARVTTAAKSGVASIKFDNYNYAAGTSSALTSSPINFPSNTGTATLTFHYAHRTYNATSPEADKLEVLVSTNCGSSWTSLWSRQGSALPTVTTASTTAFTPTASQWTTSPITIDLTSYKSQSIQLRFVATSAYGNNLYLDDIAVANTVTTPLQLVSFTAAQKNDQAIQVDWKTINEFNCASFTVEKSANGRSFNHLQTIAAQNLASNTYGMVDHAPFNGANYYRLQQLDKDGKITYSNVVLVNTKKGNANSFIVYPNPVKQNAVLNINSTTASKAEVKITDQLGKVVFTKSFAVTIGNLSTTLNVETLPAGVYNVTIAWGVEIQTQKLIKQ